MTAPLPPTLRNLLAKTIRQARRTGEAGARQALQSLAVDRAKPIESMALRDQSLRNRLRLRGQQAGDQWDRKTGVQQLDHLAHEVAYEHWHRMLFARFLAENRLLRHPEHGVDLSLEDCRELADDEGVDPWEYAARCAQEMLPQIFRQDDPVLELSLPPETRQEFERLLDELPEAVFTAPDSLGWTYQFWQAERKDEINRGGGKIGADELPAVTQLFTEHYMVLFLLHNTIGAWRAGRILADRPDLARAAAGEEELRRSVRLETGGGYDFSYLRFVRGVREGDEGNERTGPWRPASGSFPDWPREAASLRVLDPCCGSGHFLVEAFELLVRLRMAEERVSVEEAIRAVLRDNLFGLEIDPRCTQIAAFNLALAAWRMAGEPIDLPPLSIACTGLAPNASEAEWRQLAESAEDSTGLAKDRDLFGGDASLARGPLQEGMVALHKLFRRAPELGSLLDPGSLGSDLFRADFKSLAELLDIAIRQEKGSGGRDERAVAAAGMARAAEILQGRYTLVVTNVPFLARGKQGSGLRGFAESRHGDAKGDIATVFVSRIFGWLGEGGTQAVVTPQNWLFLKSYQKLRERLLKRRTWNLVARLGPGAFETISGHVVNPTLTILSAGHPKQAWEMTGITVAAACGRRELEPSGKARALAGLSSDRDTGVRIGNPGQGNPTRGRLLQIDQESLRTGTHVVVLSPEAAGTRVRHHARAWQGLVTGDDARFLRRHWERIWDRDAWVGLQTAPRVPAFFSGRDTIIHWQQGHGELHDSPTAHNFPPASVLGRSGVAIQQMSGLLATVYTGSVFGPTVAPLIPVRNGLLPAFWSFCSSDGFCDAVRAVNPKINVTPGSFGDVPIDLDRWKKVAARQYPNGLPEPYSNDPTQWIFHGDPCLSVVWNEETKRIDHGPPRIHATVLHVAVARLLGYRWPAERDPSMRLAPEQRDLVDDCRAFDEFTDQDGIVCLSVARGEPNATDRLRALLAHADGDQWSTATERALLEATGPRPPKSLEDWLRDRFFQEHCKLFHNRPFIWHIWDGRKDGFHALVNYHRLAGPEGKGRRTLESLTFAYLNEWIERQRTDQGEGVPGADGRLAAALDLQQQLQRIRTGEPPCDIFVRWRPLHEQGIGWEPDINDGVRLNIRPFMRAQLRKGSRAGAGILRWKPNVSWKKDRGKEPEEPRPPGDFPWFWGCPGGGSEGQRTDFSAAPDAEFDGNRWNDLYYTRTVKEAARGANSEVGADD